LLPVQGPTPALTLVSMRTLPSTPLGAEAAGDPGRVEQTDLPAVAVACGASL
jgi:hypothetical protein